MARLTRLLERLRASSFNRNVALLFLGTVVGQAIPILVSPLLTRLYSPESFGVLGAFSAIAMSLIPLATFRFEFALLLATQPSDVAKAHAAAMISIVSFCALATAAITPFSLEHLIGVPALDHVKYLLPMALFMVSFYQLMVYDATRLGDFGPIARTKVIQGFTGPTIQIGLGIAHFGALGLCLGFIAGQASGTMSLFNKLLRSRWPDIVAVRRGELLQFVKKYSRFPLLSSWSGVLQEAGSSYLLIILVLAFFDSSVAGYLFLADRIVGRPLLLITSSTLQAFAADMSQRIVQEPATLPGRYLRVLGGQFVICVAWCGLVAFSVPHLAGPIFGSDWNQAVPTIQIMCAAYVMQATIHAVYPTLQIAERQGLVAVLEITRFFIVVATVTGGALNGMAANDVLAIYAASQSVFNIVVIGLQFKALRRLQTEATPKRPVPNSIHE